MATRLQRAMPAFLYYVSHYRGQLAMIVCRNGHHIFGTICAVDMRTDLVWLSQAIVRRGEDARDITTGYTSVNAYGIQAMVITTRYPIEPTRYDLAETIWRTAVREQAENRFDITQPLCSEDYRGLQHILELCLGPLTGRHYHLGAHPK
uniref:Dynein heavy chain 1, axonemal n=1 Tax=Lygus hesperus TaxID=30085 RepID=A0A0A9Y3W8_LYGHE